MTPHFQHLQPTPALDALRARVRRFVDEVAIPAESAEAAHDWTALDRVLIPLRAQAQSAGLYLPQMPIEHGGLGLTWVERAVVLEEAGRSFLAPAAMNCAPPDQPNMISLLRQGSPDQQARYLQPLLRGDVRSCFAMTEPSPGAGSDPAMLQTRAQRVEGGWEITGHKWFITGACGAGFAIVLAQTEHGPTQFIVDASTPGFDCVRAIPCIDPFAIGGHGEIRLTQCRVSDAAVLGQVGQGLVYAQVRLEPARLSHCMRFIGRARRALEIAMDHVQHRTAFGERLADTQQIQAMVADAEMDLHMSRLLVLDCASRMDAAQSIKTESAMTKIMVSEAVNRVADRAAQMMGARGMSEDTAVAWILNELRPFRIYDGASELHRATLGRRLLRPVAGHGTGNANR